MTSDPSEVVGGIATSPRMLRSGLVPLSMSEALMLGLAVAPLELECRRPSHAATRAVWRPAALVLEVFRLGGIVGDLDAFDLRREDDALVVSPTATVRAPGKRGVWTSMRGMDVVSDETRELAESAQRMSAEVAVTAALSRAEAVLGPSEQEALAFLHLGSRRSRRTLTVPAHAGVLEVALAGALTWAAAANVVAIEVVLPPSTWDSARRLMRRLAPLAPASIVPEAVHFRDPARATRLRPRAGTLVVVPWAEQVTARLGDRLVRALSRWPVWLLVDHEPPGAPRFVARMQRAAIESVEHLTVATQVSEAPEVQVLPQEMSAYRDLLPALRSRLPQNVSLDALAQLTAGPEWADGVFSAAGATVPPELADRLDQLVPSAKLVQEAEACRRATRAGRGRRVVASQSRPLGLLRELLADEGIDVGPVVMDVRLAAHAVTVGPTAVGWSWAVLDTAWMPELRQVMEIARVGGDWHAGSQGERAGIAALLEVTGRALRAQVDPSALLAGRPGGARRWRTSLLASLVDGQPPDVSWLPRAVEHARRRARRVSAVDGESPTVGAPAPRAAQHDLSRAVGDLQQMLRARGVEVQRLPNGSFVVTASRPGAGLSVGTVLLLDRAGDGADVDLRPTSPAGSLLLHDVGGPALSIEVPALPAATDLPTLRHVDGLRLVSREYRSAGSVEVEGQARAGDVSGVCVEPYRHGMAVRTGRPRRTLAREERGGLPGAGGVAELTALLRSVESDLLEQENRRMMTARVVVGDDVTVIETWDGPAGRAEVICDLTADATSLIHRDSRGERIRTLDMCGGAHLTDVSWCRTCDACGTRRCPTCPDGATLRPCMICGTPACGSCRAEGPCAQCRSARPAPSLDTEHEVGWHLGDADLRLGSRHAWLRRASDRDWTLLVPDGDADSVLHARMRGVALAAGRGVGTQYWIADPPLVRDRAPSVIFARERSVVSWEETEGDVALGERRPPNSVAELPAAGDLPAREEGAYRLAQLLSQLRERRPPPAARDVIGFTELERTELRLQVGRLWEVVVSHRHGRRAREVSRVEVPLAPPVTPRHDADGHLLLQGRRHGLVVEVVGINASHLLRLDDHGEVRELFRSRRKAPTAASELGWHRLALANGLPAGAAVVREAGTMRRRASVGDAMGVGATRTEQQVTPRPVFRRVDEDHQMVVARDLRLLDREVAYSRAELMADGLAQQFDLLVDHYLAAPAGQFAVDVVWHVEETWVGRSDADVVYVVQGKDPTWPPLDDTGKPGECVAVDSFGHLHTPSETWSCEACDRWYCRGCGEAGLFTPCPGCRRTTCPECLGASPRMVGSATCQRCGIASCAECGRDPETVRCLVCRRELCRSCSPHDVCLTCGDLRPIDTTAVRLPDELAASGCTVWSSSDEDADVVMVRGRGRREIALLREGRVSVWMTAETASETNLQILLARATGVHCDLLDLHPPVQDDGLAIGRTVRARVVLPTGVSWTVSASDVDLRTRLTSVLDDGRDLPVEMLESSDITWPPPPAEAWQAVRPQPPLHLVAVTDDGVVCRSPSGRPLTIEWSERHGAHSWYGRRCLAHVEGVRLEVYVTGGDVRLVLKGEDGPRGYVLVYDTHGLVDRSIARVLGRPEAAVDVVAIADPTMTAGFDGVSIDRAFRPVAHVVAGGTPIDSHEVATILGARPEVEGQWATLPDETRARVAVSSDGASRPRVAVAWEVTEHLQGEGVSQTVIYQLVPTESGTRVLTSTGIWDSRPRDEETTP